MKTNSPIILLVDDEPDLLTGLRRNFAKRLPESAVITASGGKEALSLLAKQEVT